MDPNDWIVIYDDEYADVNEDSDQKPIIFGKINPDLRSVLDMNYFPKKTSKTSRDFHQKVLKEIVHVPIQLNPKVGNVQDEGLVEENIKDQDHVEGTLVPSPTSTEKIKGVIFEADHNTVSQLLSKIKEIDSPKSVDGELFPSSDIGETQEIMPSSKVKIEKELTIMECDKEVENSSDGFNFWKWSLNGVGAICSFGVAAATTICVLHFGSQQRNKIQKIRFQIYSDDKRIKQVVQHSTKLNGPISVVSGVPRNRGTITCGDYYGGL